MIRILIILIALFKIEQINADVTSFIDNKYVNKLPILVTDVADENKIELQLTVPDNFCPSSLVKRVDGNFYTKEYIPCERLHDRKAEKIFYIFYNQGKSMNSAKDLIEADKQKFDGFCSSHQILSHEVKEFDGYMQANVLTACMDVNTNQKTIMFIQYFSSQSDCSGFHYAVRVDAEYPNDFVTKEIVGYVNSPYVSILKAGLVDSNITCCKDLQK